MTKLRLVVDVEYEAGDVTDADLARLMHEIAIEAFGDGRFTSDLDASVLHAEARVSTYTNGLWFSIGVPTIISSGDGEE